MAELTATERIANRRRVEDVFGSWSSFHDCLLRAIRLTAGDRAIVEIDILAPAAYEKRGEYHYPIRPHLVTLRFTDATDIFLQDFGAENIIGELVIALDSNDRAAVRIEPIPGVGGELALTCAEMEVVSVVAATA